ncbi:pentapeptide repeat-containing protein [Stenomitos frigidus]|uniref:Pentapeptide repeat-containing protein n=1 Tax=Stenomitos frigidus ULC18 TaxID=2107698 RepID=A0A2T1DWC0_9CYAN|nr:pentapeptide repeat-containing protein [Stenomitos frigidus]PSB24787.1 hypothetical protein C7B82_25605 [Stenomitos frigidus ULC18]
MKKESLEEPPVEPGTQLSQQATDAQVQESEDLIKLRESFKALDLETDPIKREYLLAEKAKENNLAIGKYRRLFGLYEKTLPPRFPTWTGFQGKTAWDLLQLVVVPLGLALAAFLLQFWASSNQQKLSDDQNREKQKLSDDQDREKAFNAYIDNIERLMPTLRNAQPEDEISIIARTRTLTVFRQLKGDGQRKGQVIRFLKEANLIKRRDLKVDLSTADLSQAVLKDIDLSKTHFFNVNLQEADLRGTSFKDTELRRAKLERTKLEKAEFQGADLSGANLQDAQLDPELNDALQIAAKLTEKQSSQALPELPFVGICGATLPDGKRIGVGCPGPQAISGGAAYAAERIYIRSSPGIKSPTIGSLEVNDKIRLTGAERYADGSTWVQLEDGGWIVN